MKWWIVITAAIALILASVSIWFGSSVTQLVVDAQFLRFASLVLAYLANLLGTLNAPVRRRRNWAIVLRSLWSLTSIFGMIGALNILPKGPFCSRFLSDGSSICAQNTPLATDVFLFTPVFLFSIIALMYVFWPSKQNPVLAAGQTV